MGKSGRSKKKFFWQNHKSSEDGNHTSDLLEKSDTGNGRAVGGGGEAGHEEFNPPDGGWGWIVCLTSLWANGTVFGIINTFGIVYVQMREHYSKDDPEVSLKTAFVGSTCTGVTFLMCTVSSILSDRVGIRLTAAIGATIATIGLLASAFIEKLELLYLTFGLMLGVGSSMVYSPSLVILGHYFKKHMGLVNGLVAFGSSLFTIGLTRILPYLLSSIGIKYVFIFLAGLQFMLVIFAWTWKPLFRKEEQLARLTLSTESVYQHCQSCCTWTKRFLNVKIWRNRAYVTWVISLGIALFGYFVPFFHLPKYTADTFPGEDGSWLILCLSITSGVSRIVCGKVADLPWVSRIRMQQVAFLVLGISTLCIPFAGTFGGLIAISLAMGVCDGIFVCLLGPIAFDIVGKDEASQAIGFLLGIFSIPFTIGPPLAGYMYDTMGNYRVAFHVAGAPPILGAIVMFLIPKVQQSFPAVTETMEFASMSVVDIYSEVRVPKERTKLPASPLSGPATELQLIQSSELLYLGDHNDKAKSDSRHSNHVEDEAVGNHAGDRKHSDNDHNDLKDHTDGDNEASPMLEVDQNENIDDTSKTDVGKLDKDNSNEDMIKNDEARNPEENSNLDMPRETNPESTDFVINSGSLLDEVGKYFDAVKTSFDDDKQTVL